MSDGGSATARAMVSADRSGKGIQINLRLRRDLVAQLDAIADAQNERDPWHRVSRVDVARRMMEVGLRVQSAPPSPPAAPSAPASKRRR
jgi:hypothetical protein